MKHIISVSGGIGSYFALKRVLESNRKEDVLAVFCDTLAEDGDLYRFLNDIEEKLDIKIFKICEGKSPFELAWEDNFLYNSRVANCSKKLKSRPFKKWLKANYKPDECILYLGIDWTEKHRCNSIVKNYSPYQVAFPMCEKPYVSKDEMLEDLKNDGIKIPRLYELGFSHNNCGGCCFKAGLGNFKLLLEKDRNRYLEFENKEDILRRKLNRDVTILKRKGGHITLRDYIKILEDDPSKITTDDIIDIGGCGCFVEEDDDSD